MKCFLGCFLRLVNEEEMPRIQIELELCDGCGACVAFCPVKVANPEACLGIRAKQLCSECRETAKTCLGCVACVKSCPTAAIEILET
jgi:ferredoxin